MLFLIPLLLWFQSLSPFQAGQIIVALALLGTIIIIVSEKIDKTIIALIGAFIALFVAISPFSEPSTGNAIITNVEGLFHYLEPDLLLVILGVTLLVGLAAPTGLFEWATLKLLKIFGKGQYRLITMFCFLMMFFSALLDAYMAIVVIGSVIVVASQALDVNPKPYLLGAAIFGNIGGTVTRVASPPNLIIGGHFGIDFVTFAIWLIPYAIPTGIVSLLILFWLFRSDLRTPISDFRIGQVKLIDESSVIPDKTKFRLAALVLIFTIFGFAVASFLPLHMELGFVAMFGAVLMIIIVVGRHPHEEIWHHVEWPIVFFLAGILFLVGIAEHMNLLHILAVPIETLFRFNEGLGIIILQWITTIISGFLDNVPVSSVMVGVLDEMIADGVVTSFLRTPLLISIVIGTNMGGNLTIIGSASTVQAVSILKQDPNKNRHVSFTEFLKYGSVLVFAQLVLGTLYLTLAILLAIGAVQLGLPPI